MRKNEKKRSWVFDDAFRRRYSLSYAIATMTLNCAKQAKGLPDAWVAALFGIGLAEKRKMETMISHYNLNKDEVNYILKKDRDEIIEEFKEAGIVWLKSKSTNSKN